jgi:dihydrofolate reductase
VKLSIVVAMTRGELIGRDGRLPWHLPRDLKQFRRLTWGKPIIMGRKTYESLGRPLPGRTNIILTRQSVDFAEGCKVAHTPEEAIALAAATGASEAMIIGGSEVYREFLPRCESVYVTLVEGSFEGDTYFPGNPTQSPEWQIVSEEHCPADERNAASATFLELVRRVPAREGQGQRPPL